MTTDNTLLEVTALINTPSYQTRWQRNKHKNYNQYWVKRRKIISDELFDTRLKFKALRATVKQTDIAKELNLSRTAINNVLNGQMRSQKILDKIKNYVELYFDTNNEAMTMLYILYKKNISQRQIAKELKLNQSLVCRVIHGKAQSKRVEDYLYNL